MGQESEKLAATAETSVEPAAESSSCGCGCGCGGKKRRTAEEKRRGSLGTVPEGRKEISLVAK